MRGILRPPEQPTWALMVTDAGTIVPVREIFAAEKVSLGWFTVARESDLLPFNPPRLIQDDDDGA